MPRSARRSPSFHWKVFSALALALLGGCRDERVLTFSSALSLHTLSACSPRGTSQITIEALGDYPADEASFASIDARDGEQTLASLPLAARLARVSVINAGFRGVGISPIADDGQRFDALVLPVEKACSARIEGFVLRPFASAALIAGEDVLLAGGLARDDVAESSTTRLRVAQQRVARSPDMFVPRAHAFALDLGSEVWLLGGTQSVMEGAPAFDTYERYDVSSNRFGVLGRMAQERLSPGAVKLADGSALVVGGAAEVGAAPLDSLERIDPTDPKGRLLEARLPRPMMSPRVLLRDDGIVVIAASTPDFTLALYDPASDTLETLGAPAPNLDPQLVVTLPGARTLIVETDQGFTTGALHVLDATGKGVRLSGSLTSFANLSSARALALRDGRVLLTGSVSGSASARLIDPGTLTVKSLSLDLVPEHLFLREDGAVVMLGAGRVTLLRSDSRTIYDSPGGTLLAEDDGVLALDVQGHFAREGLRLRALVDDARLDLAGLSYEDVKVEIEASGATELLLRRVPGAERVIEVGDATIGPALCTIAHEPSARVTIERAGNMVQISSGDETTSCVLDGLDQRIALGVRVRKRGERLEWLSVTRE